MVKCPAVKRRLLNLLAAVSLVLWVATLMMARTGWEKEWSWKQQVVEREVSWTVAAICSDRIFRIGYARDVISRNVRDDMPRAKLILKLIWAQERASVRPITFFHPIEFYRDNWQDGEGYWAVSVSVWLPIILFGALPVICTWRLVSERRVVPLGHCVCCGYDLRVQIALSKQSALNGRASKDRCPECGTAINGIKLITTPRPD